MDRKVKVLLYGKFCGVLSQDVHGFTFEYDASYKGRSLSLSMPLDEKRFESKELPPFFLSLAPEGGLKKRYSELQKIDENELGVAEDKALFILKPSPSAKAPLKLKPTRICQRHRSCGPTD